MSQLKTSKNKDLKEGKDQEQSDKQKLLNTLKNNYGYIFLMSALRLKEFY